MKASTEKPTIFVPTEIRILCETQEELDAFGCLFNTCGVADAFMVKFGIKLDAITDAITAAGGEVSGMTMAFHKELHIQSSR